MIPDLSVLDILMLGVASQALSMVMRRVIEPAYLPHAADRSEEPLDPFFQQAYDEALAELDELYGVTDAYNLNRP